MKLKEPIVPPEVLQQIFDSPIPYTDDDEKALAQDLFSTLQGDDVEIAAQGSYAYWLASISDNPPSAEIRDRMALREARRHVFRVKFEDAVVNLKNTCNYRRERRIDLYRACFTENIEFDNKDDENAAEILRNQILSDLNKQAAFIRGCDKSGRALLIQRDRTVKDTQDEEFVVTQVYLMERAIAATEFVSRGVQEKVVVVLDFGAFKSSLAPTLAAVKAMASILQTKYSERLKNLIAIDPPLWLRTMYGMIKPFLDPVTKAKFVMARGDKEKLDVLTEIVSPEQAMPFMMPNGKLTAEVDLARFTRSVPFHSLYDGV